MPRKYTRRPLADRWHDYVLMTDDHWWWEGATDPKGYGFISRGGKYGGHRMAHRVAWELYRGPIPPGLWVLHTCDHPRCVNPDHLFVGTAADNNADARRKGRAHRLPPLPRGEAHPRHKLSDAAVAEVLMWSRAGVLGYVLARAFGVGQSTISRVKRGERQPGMRHSGP